MRAIPARNLGTRKGMNGLPVGFLFLLFGEYKLASPVFAHAGFPQYLQGYIHNEAVSFYRPFLARIIQPHTVFFGYAVGVLELWIAVSMIAGVMFTRAVVVLSGMALRGMR